MTAEEKTLFGYFLKLTGDYLAGGHVRYTEPEKPKLPLAYTTEEPADFSEAEETPEITSEIIIGDSLEAVAENISACKACGLATARTQVVPGEGASNPLVMVIGEGPGADEDTAGRPFVGKAGQLLDKMLESIGLFRSKNCFIANMVKCRPPGNRDPEPEEVAACFPYLERQILLMRPRIILCAGRVAAQSLLKTSRGINMLRGAFHELKIGETAIPVLPSFHPSALLRDESLKRPAWEDLKLLKSKLLDLVGDYAGGKF